MCGVCAMAGGGRNIKRKCKWTRMLKYSKEVSCFRTCSRNQLLLLVGLLAGWQAWWLSSVACLLLAEKLTHFLVGNGVWSSVSTIRMFHVSI